MQVLLYLSSIRLTFGVLDASLHRSPLCQFAMQRAACPGAAPCCHEGLHHKLVSGSRLLHAVLHLLPQCASRCCLRVTGGGDDASQDSQALFLQTNQQRGARISRAGGCLHHFKSGEKRKKENTKHPSQLQRNLLPSSQSPGCNKLARKQGVKNQHS